MKMSKENIFNKTLFYIKPVIFGFLQKPSSDCMFILCLLITYVAIIKTSEKCDEAKVEQ